MSTLAFSANETFLRDFHRRFPGCTPAGFGSGSSYEILASHVPGSSTGPLTVLDVACGDGHLLELLARRRQPGLALVGIDLSDGELEAARRRPALAGARLFEARAQALPLPDASVDVVLSHMALMLMDELDQVVREIRRVLRPGGRLAAIVGNRVPGPAAEAAFIRALKSALEAEGKLFLGRIGDPRMRAPEGLAEVFGKAAGFAGEPALEELMQRQQVTPEDARDHYLLMYDVGQLSAEGRARFADRLLAEFRALAADSPTGRLELVTGMRLVTSRT